MKVYLLNCFLLLIPILLWNLIFTKSLPEAYSREFFWTGVPKIIGTTENILRIIVMILPLVMSLSLKNKIQITGFTIYLIGVIVYFLSWLAQLYLPKSMWSKSLLGFMAPAYTTVLWFVGIGLIGQKSVINIPSISLIYIVLSVLFVVFHTFHAYIVYQKL